MAILPEHGMEGTDSSEDDTEMTTGSCDLDAEFSPFSVHMILHVSTSVSRSEDTQLQTLMLEPLAIGIPRAVAFP